MQRDPRISIVVATLNSVDNLQRCISSIVSQDYTNKELIIVDGASTDGTVALIQANEPSVHHWLSEPDRGYYNAVNKALDHVTGEWVYFLGSDDYFLSHDCLRRVAERLVRVNSDVLIAYGMVALGSPEGELQRIQGQPWRYLRQLMHVTNPIPTQGVFHRKAVYELYGRYNELFRIGGDYEFLLRVLRKHEPHFLADVVVAVQTVGGLSTTPQSQVKAISEFCRARSLNGLRANRFSSFWHHRSIYFKVVADLLRHLAGLPFLRPAGRRS